jgi:hypothetical protein
MTLWAAYQHFEESTKGSIEVGKLADFAILSEDPLSVPRERLGELKVMQTVKRGRTVWRLDPLQRADGCAHSPDCAQGLAMLERRLALYAALSPTRPAQAR